MKVSEFLIFLFVLLINLNEFEAHKRCNEIYNCNKEEIPCWASDGISCAVFRNKCWMESENCNRRNNYAVEFKLTTKIKCQTLCVKRCFEFYDPVCTEYRGGKYEFLNNCYMKLNDCLTGETHLVNSSTRCQC